MTRQRFGRQGRLGLASIQVGQIESLGSREPREKRTLPAAGSCPGSHRNGTGDQRSGLQKCPADPHQPGFFCWRLFPNKLAFRLILRFFMSVLGWAFFRSPHDE